MLGMLAEAERDLVGEVCRRHGISPRRTIGGRRRSVGWRSRGAAEGTRGGRRSFNAARDTSGAGHLGAKWYAEKILLDGGGPAQPSGKR
jgi:hypothetical protein